MRSFSLFKIILLCLAILIVDSMVFYWLKFIVNSFDLSQLKTVIYIIYWSFTTGLITSIILLKIRLSKIHPKVKQLLISYLYGLVVSSFIPKLIFVIAISGTFFTSFVFSKGVALLVILLIGIIFGFLPFIAIIYGIFKALYQFKIRQLKIHFEKLPTTFNKLKIVHISDLHLGSFNSRYHILTRAIKIINRLEPDLIFFTGDLVNNYAWELKGWAAVFKKLSARIGKYSVLGNHDYGDYSQWRSVAAKQSNFELIKYFFKKIDFKLLLNDTDIIEIDGEEIAIIGVENWGNPPFKQYGDLKKALKNTSSTPFKILLSHDPSHWREEVVKNTSIALTLSGHTHGMQAGIHLGNKKWSPIKYKYKHWAGLYEYQKQFLYVNRGLGWLGFPGRLGMKPEITLIELYN